MMLKSVLALSLVASLAAGVCRGPQGRRAGVQEVPSLSRGRGGRTGTKWGRNSTDCSARPAGSVPDYNYSDANKNSGIVWTPEVFAEYIKNPRAYIPGTAMAFAGLKKDTDIEDVTGLYRAVQRGRYDEIQLMHPKSQRSRRRDAAA